MFLFDTITTEIKTLEYFLKFMRTSWLVIFFTGAFLNTIFPAFADFSDVQMAIIQEDYQKSLTLAEETLATESDASKKKELRYYLALSHLRLNHFTEASLMFENLIKERLDSKLKDKVYLGLFDSYYLAENYPKAYVVAEKYFKRNFRSEFLSLYYLKTARVSLKLAKWDEAREFLKKIIDGFPSSLEAQTAKQLLNEKQYFAVQVGAFMDQSRSEQMADELKKKNEYAYIVETSDAQGRQFFRVRVGQLASLDEAQQLQARLSKLGYPTQIYP